MNTVTPEWQSSPICSRFRFKHAPNRTNSVCKSVPRLDLLFGSDPPTLRLFSVSQCLRGRVWFPIPAMSRDSGSRTIQIGEARFAALCLRPSARHPPPIDVLLIAKTKPQFDRPVIGLSTPLSRVSEGSKSVSISAPCLLVSAFGRQRVVNLASAQY